MQRRREEQRRAKGQARLEIERGDEMLRPAPQWEAGRKVYHLDRYSAQ